MKKIIFLALFTILFSSCRFSEDSRINKTIVCGKVTGYKQTSEHNMVTLLVPNLFTEKQVLYDLIKDDGSFRFEFDLNYPIDIELEYFGRPRLYASPGDSLYITIDGNCWTNVINNNQELYDLYQVSGRGSLLAQEVKNYSVFFEDSINIDFHTSDSIVKTSSPLEYASYMDEKLNHDLKRLDSYLSAQQDGKLVQEWAQTDIKQNNWWYRMRYIWTHPMKTGENMKQFVASIPESYYNFLYDANLTVDDFKTSWFAAIMQELDVKTTISIPQEIEDSVFFGDVYIGDQIRFEIENYQSQYNGFFKDILIAKRFYRELENHELNNLADVCDTSLIVDVKVKSQLQAVYEKEKVLYEQIQAKGNSYLHIVDSDSDFINDIKAKYQGKAIYIDFWAPWCAPCMTEIEYSKGIKEKLKEKDVVFVYVGWNCTEESWKATITEKGIKGEHYILDKEDLAILNKELDINGIPHYTLINRQGEIIFGDAPRPSDNDILLNAIDEALNI